MSMYMWSGVSLSNKNSEHVVTNGRQRGFQETTIIWKGPPDRQKGQDIITLLLFWIANLLLSNNIWIHFEGKRQFCINVNIHNHGHQLASLSLWIYSSTHRKMLLSFRQNQLVIHKQQVSLKGVFQLDPEMCSSAPSPHPLLTVKTCRQDSLCY